MTGPIVFYFDFASPYAYFALDGVVRLGAETKREVIWRPVLVWAVLKAQGIAAPMETPAKRAYMVKDMVRSAEFSGQPYVHPSKLPLSAHHAMRLYYAIEQEDREIAQAFAREVFAAFFTRDQDISDQEVVVDVAARVGIGDGEARKWMSDDYGRWQLSQMVDRAVADGVIGSPYFIAEGEGFFGADRLPQLAWRLSQPSFVQSLLRQALIRPEPPEQQ